MDACVIAPLKRKYGSRLCERAIDMMEGDDTLKLYQADSSRSLEWMSDFWVKMILL